MPVRHGHPGNGPAGLAAPVACPELSQACIAAPEGWYRRSLAPRDDDACTCRSRSGAKSAPHCSFGCLAGPGLHPRSDGSALQAAVPEAENPKHRKHHYLFIYLYDGISK